MKVYVLQHERECGDGSSDVKMIGVYRTEQDALDARARLSKAPGFKDCIDGFAIDGYELGQDHWTEGYVQAPSASQKSGKRNQAA